MRKPFTLFLCLLAPLASPAGADDLVPQNPVALCDRFIKPTEMKDCEKKAEKLDLDWYASSVCGLVDDDQALLKCWKNIEKRSFSVQSLNRCRGDMSDQARLDCLKNAGAQSPSKGRSPASRKSDVYQKLGR